MCLHLMLLGLTETATDDNFLNDRSCRSCMKLLAFTNYYEKARQLLLLNHKPIPRKCKGIAVFIFCFTRLFNKSHVLVLI